MKTLHNENGIALVTSLMFTVMSLVITMSLLYMVTSSIKTSGAMVRYRTATQAAYGATDIIVKDLITLGFAFHDVSSASNPFTTYMKNDTSLKYLDTPTVSNCLRAKLTSAKSQWPSSCTDTSISAKPADISFNLKPTSGTPFTVYSKIIDTMERKFTVLRNNSSIPVKMAGNSDTSIFALEGGSTTDGSGVTVPHYPYIYRIEIQAERAQNAAEKSKISVQYAY